MYDVIVVGAGHAGYEAAMAAANMGLKTLLATGNLNMTAGMTCNPSIGGPAKGVVVREIDALGGYMGKNADLCQIPTKMLDRSKGLAVWSLRFQCDKLLYAREMQKHLETVENLDIVEGIVEDILTDGDSVSGIMLKNGDKIMAKAVVLTTGTYLDSRILRGHWTIKEGPDGQRTSKGISAALRRMSFTIQRLKTGNPARIKASTIDFSKVSVENGNEISLHFGFDKGYESLTGVKAPCFLAYTNEEIHNLIRAN
jgi:tRNA uridine 5-carboxymethylaminomethyl modification enzyme